jgi:hypothetical protein
MMRMMAILSGKQTFCPHLLGQGQEVRQIQVPGQLERRRRCCVVLGSGMPGCGELRMRWAIYSEFVYKSIET